MYCVEREKCNYLSAYAYFKNFFDRFTALLAYETNYKRGRINGKPNFNNFYEENKIKKCYEVIQDSDTIIHDAHQLRNHNPINHASAELIDINIYSIELVDIIKKLHYLISEYMKVNKVY